MKKERQGEYYVRLGLAILVAILGAYLVWDSVSKQLNGFQIIVGLELLGGSYFITSGTFSGFKSSEPKNND